MRRRTSWKDSQELILKLLEDEEHRLRMGSEGRSRIVGA